MSGYRYSALVVDDEDAVRKLTVRALERHGFHCSEAADGADAARLLAVRHYHVLISDLRMPNGNGYSLATDVLERAERPLIVILTGVMEPRLAQDLVRRGVDDIMFKPVDYEMFAGKVAGLMARRVDQGSQPDECTLPTGSPEMDGLATSREAKLIIDGYHGGQSDSSTSATADLGADTRTTAACSSPTPVAANDAVAAEPVTPCSENQPDSSNACVAQKQVPDHHAASSADARPAGLPRIRPWVATILRTLTGKELAWIAAAGLLLFSVWLSMQVHMFRQMNRAVDALERLGARIAVSKTAGTSVWFERDQRPSGLGELHEVPNLRRLELAYTRATNDDLAPIGRLTDIEELDLQQTEITDEGLAYLENLSGLRRLSLRGTSVTDAGLMHLRKLRALRALSLLETGVSAQGAQRLQRVMPLTRIEHESLQRIEVNGSESGNGSEPSRRGSGSQAD